MADIAIVLHQPYTSMAGMPLSTLMRWHAIACQRSKAQ